MTVHQAPITQSGWTGSGYIITDPATGAGAYMISGGANGGFIFTFIATALCLIAAVFSFGVLSPLVASLFLIWEIINVILWINAINSANNDAAFNRANAGQFIGAVLGLTSFGGVARAELVKWMGLFRVLMLTSF